VSMPRAAKTALPGGGNGAGGGGATSAVSSAGGGGVGVSRMYQDVLREVK
jgi:hypothetical protein